MRREWVVEALKGGSDAHVLSDTRAAMGIAGAGNGRMAGNTLLPGDPAREATGEIIIMPMPTATVISPVTILMSRLVLAVMMMMMMMVRINSNASINQEGRNQANTRLSSREPDSDSSQSSMDRRSDAGGGDGLFIAAPRSDCVQIRRTVDGATMLAG